VPFITEEGRQNSGWRPFLLTSPPSDSTINTVMKNKNKLKEIHPNVVFIKAPKGVDVDIVGEIIGDDNWDIIFLDNGIVCKVDRVDDVLEAYEQALEETNEDKE
jgi:hypothetical protein